MNYDLSVKARIDLQDIWLYTYENWSVEQADMYVTLLIDEMARHSRNPPLGRDRSQLTTNYKSFQFKSHIVFYREKVNKRKIEIIRILHKSMDIENRLRD